MSSDAELRRLIAGRDPRVDPREGDVVESLCSGGFDNPRSRRVIEPTADETGLGTQWVIYQATPRPLGVTSRPCSIKAWRRWAKGGRVVCRGAP